MGIGQVFIAHASEESAQARNLAAKLQGRGHKVFHDADSLPPAQSYDDRIRAAIQDSAVFVFLVSPSAVAKGRYTLTELSLARKQWPKPAGFVLPVMVVETPFCDIDPYLVQSVTILRTHGNFETEVADAVAELLATHNRHRWWWMATAVALIAIAVTVTVVRSRNAGATDVPPPPSSTIETEASVVTPSPGASIPAPSSTATSRAGPLPGASSGLSSSVGKPPPRAGPGPKVCESVVTKGDSLYLRCVCTDAGTIDSTHPIGFVERIAEKSNLVLLYKQKHRDWVCPQ